MAAPSVDPQPLAPDTPSSRPSLRRRLFSPPTWKSPKQPVDEPIRLADHPLEHSSSTSTTITPEIHITHSVGGSNAVAQDASHNVDANTLPNTQLSTFEHSTLNPPDASRGRRTAFYRRKATKSAMAEANLSANSHPYTKPRQRTSRPRASFLTRVVHKVVPCVSPTLDHSSGEGDDTASGAPSPGLRDVDAHLRDKEPSSSEESAGVDAVPAIHVDPPSAALNVAPNSLQDTSTTDQTGVTSSAVQPPGCVVDVSRPTINRDSLQDSDLTDGEGDEDIFVLSEQEQEDRLIKNGGAGIPIGLDGLPKPLLPPITPKHAGRKCLVLDLDETLVHSSFKAVQQADFIVPVEIEYHWHHFHVLKRPGVDNFLKKMGEIYEVVVFTASLSKYADPVLDKLDIHQVVAHRLFRESCFNHKGNYVKDLSQLGRPIAIPSFWTILRHPIFSIPITLFQSRPGSMTHMTQSSPTLFRSLLILPQSQMSEAYLTVLDDSAARLPTLSQ